MYFTGFADEASPSIDGQIEVTRALGWKNIEARQINGVNLHDVTEEVFGEVSDYVGGSLLHITRYVSVGI